MIPDGTLPAAISRHIDVSRETLGRLSQFAAIVKEDTKRQNLIAQSTVEALWTRHIVDSAQLLLHAPRPAGAASWLDLGSGAGFPGIVIALLSPVQMTLAEPRRLRVEFLRKLVAEFDLAEQVTICAARIESIPPRPFKVITARAFAPLSNLLKLAHPFSTENTVWILPKGRGAQTELDAARAAWQGQFCLEPSLTDPDASIVVAQNVQPVRQGNKQ